MQNNSVLIVTYGFPPHIKSLGGAIRMLKLAEYLQKSGCRVHVVCARTAHQDSFGYDDLLTSLDITYVEDPVATRGAELYRDSAIQVSTGIRAVRSTVRRVVKHAVIEALTPDTGVLVSHMMRKAAQEIVVANPNITVVTSGPPHSAHLVGRWLKRRYPNIQWVVDYRDSWNGTPLFRKRTALLQVVNERLERRVLAECDIFSYISSPMLAKAEDRGGPGLRRKSAHIANGFDSALLDIFKGAHPSAGTFRLGYFGAIDDRSDGYRNPESIFCALSRSPQLDLRIELYGNVKISRDWQQVLGPRLFIGERLSHVEALRKMAEMDALLLLHTRDDGADEVVTGKVFEYVASARPILSIGPSNMEVNKMMDGDQAYFHALHTDQSVIIDTLHQLVQAKHGSAVAARAQSRIALFEREMQYSKLLELINQHGRQCCET